MGSVHAEQLLLLLLLMVEKSFTLKLSLIRKLYFIFSATVWARGSPSRWFKLQQFLDQFACTIKTKQQRWLCVRSMPVYLCNSSAHCTTKLNCFLRLLTVFCDRFFCCCIGNICSHCRCHCLPVGGLRLYSNDNDRDFVQLATSKCCSAVAIAATRNWQLATGNWQLDCGAGINVIMTLARPYLFGA